MTRLASLLLIFLLSPLISMGTSDAKESQELIAACTVDVTKLATETEMKLAETRCRVAYNLETFLKNSPHNDFEREVREKAYSAQHQVTLISFAMFLLLCITGLVFCVLEYRKGANSTTTIKIGASNIEISSQLFGMLILFASLAFGYVFFDKAYKISETASANPKPTTTLIGQSGDQAKPPVATPAPKL